MSERALDRRHQDGAIRGTALALLILVGLGGWNYQKSYRADLENHRSLPFESYSTDDLQSLRFAYSEELERSQVIYGQRRSALGRGGEKSAPSARLADRVAALERSQASAGALREARADLAQHEARLRDVDAELERRRQALPFLRLHLERLLRLDHDPAQSSG